MNTIILRFRLAVVMTLASVHLPAADRTEADVPAAPQQASRAWQRWEQALTSTRSYDNPYADVTLRVSYHGPGGRTLRTYGFWDGGDTFRIRCAFPVAGMWQWETECSDTANTGLHQQRGTVEVAPYQGDNLLYRHGFLKVSDNRRHLAYGDGTPFLWIGDTAWAAPQRASDEEWEAYLADRAAKHFTVDPGGTGLRVGGTNATARDRSRSPTRPARQWNPAYWQSFERKGPTRQREGLVVLLVGLMEPVHRYPEADQACLFARNIVARLFGNFVIFSPSFDSEFMPLANEVGRAAREATAVHLITQHPGTPWNQPTPTFSIQYYDEPYLDYRRRADRTQWRPSRLVRRITPSSGTCTSTVTSRTSRSSTWRPCTTPRAPTAGGRWMRARWAGGPGCRGRWATPTAPAICRPRSRKAAARSGSG